MRFKNNVVLIVDDSFTIRHQVKMILKKQSISVLEAYDQKSMMSHLSLNHKPVDLIIMDLNLKNDTGFHLMEVIRAQKEHKRTPIIVLSGNAKKDAVVASTEFDIVYYAIKPIKPADLSLKVLNAIEQSVRLQGEDGYSSENNLNSMEDVFDPFSIEDLSNELRNTRMGQINQVLNIDISPIKKSYDE